MRHTARGHGGHRSMVRTVVCGAADEGSIPSGHPTLSLAAPSGAFEGTWGCPQL